MRVHRIYGEYNKAKDPLSKEMYFHVFKPHPYRVMPDCDFCWICNHSKLIHEEYEVDKKYVEGE